MKSKNSNIEASKRAKTLAAVLGDKGIVLKHTQALDVVAKLEGSANWNTFRAVAKKKATNQPVDLLTLARQHVEKRVFETLGKWTLDTFMVELAETLAMDSSEEWQAQKHRMNKLFDSEFYEGVLIRTPHDMIPHTKLAEQVEYEIEEVHAVLATRWFAPDVERVNAALSSVEFAHTEGTQSIAYENECQVNTASGFQLHVSAFPEEVSYLRVCDPLGREVAYWTMDEVKESPEEVLGAVIGALRPGQAALGSSRPVSTEDAVIIDRRIQDWRLDEGSLLEDLPAGDCQAYRLEVSDRGCQMRIGIAPRHRKPTELNGKDQMDLFVEINDGIPCVHVTNCLYGDVVISIFATKEGLILRRNTDSLKFSSAADHPRAKKVKAERDLFVAADNTFE